MRHNSVLKLLLVLVLQVRWNKDDKMQEAYVLVQWEMTKKAPINISIKFPIFIS